MAAVSVLLGFGIWNGGGHPRLVSLAVMLAGGYPIFKEAFENVLERRMTMELSMTIALAAALVIGEVLTALVITAFVLVAELLEGLTVSRGRRRLAGCSTCCRVACWCDVTAPWSRSRSISSTRATG